MPQWEENTMNEYLFERFREDKIESDLQYLMILNKESKSKEHGYLNERGNTTRHNQAMDIDVISCEGCPFFEGWKDALGLPVVKCKLSDEILYGCSAMELYNHIHHGNHSISINVTSEAR